MEDNATNVANATAPATNPAVEPEINNAIVAKVKSVRVDELKDETGSRRVITLTLDKRVKKMMQDASKKWVETDSKMVNINAGDLFELLGDNFIVQFFLNSVEDKYNQQMLAMLMTNANIVFENVLHLKGEVIDGVALDRNKYFREFTSLELFKPVINGYVKSQLKKMGMDVDEMFD